MKIQPVGNNVLCVLSHFRLSVTPWTVARQVPLSMGFSRQEYWSGLPCLPSRDLPSSGIKPGLPHCWQIFFYHLNHQGSPRILEWVAYSFSRGNLPNPGIKLGSPALQANSLPAELPGMPVGNNALGQQSRGHDLPEHHQLGSQRLTTSAENQER